MQAAERPFFVPGKSGQIEVIEHRPETPNHMILLMCHPHPLYQGSMNNKVVTITCRAFAEQGVTSYRFNYRGVGQSKGIYGEGIGESVDALSVVQAIKALNPTKSLILAGFSFGGFIAYNIAIEASASDVILIAPSVTNMKMSALPEPRSRLLVIQGDADEIVPYPDVVSWLLTRKQDFTFFKFAGAGHFFHGKLLNLKQAVLLGFPHEA